MHKHWESQKRGGREDGAERSDAGISRRWPAAGLGRWRSRGPRLFGRRRGQERQEREWAWSRGRSKQAQQVNSPMANGQLAGHEHGTRRSGRRSWQANPVVGARKHTFRGTETAQGITGGTGTRNQARGWPNTDSAKQVDTARACQRNGAVTGPVSGPAPRYAHGRGGSRTRDCPHRAAGRREHSRRRDRRGSACCRRRTRA